MHYPILSSILIQIVKIHVLCELLKKFIMSHVLLRWEMPLLSAWGILIVKTEISI
jgi:hypothetical protein